MIIASSNMQMSSKRSYSKKVSVGTSSTITPLGSFAGAASYGRGNNRAQITRLAEKTASFKSAVKSAAGQSAANPMPSENYLSSGTLQGAGVRGSRGSSPRQRIQRYLLQYVEMIRELMLHRLSGHRTSGISYLSGSQSLSADSLDLTVNSTQEFTVWYRQDAATYSYEESEATSFSGTGTVITADGRQLSIDVQLNMSRSFTESLSSYDNSVQTILTDPLVIQLDDSPVSVSDEKFLFDIDADGVAQKISKLSAGSAFLALDRNGDGVINNGSELFGTRSGNGFKDLAAYDEDGNGWIDENDSIYKDLKLWQKDDAGNDKLTGLKEHGIGAIYLGSQSTKFSLNSLADNSTNGVIQRTGLYLKEDGQAKTIAQVDLAVG